MDQLARHLASVSPTTSAPDTSALDDAWSEEGAPRDSYIALTSRRAKQLALPPPPLVEALSLPRMSPNPSAALRTELTYDVWDSPRGMLLLFDLPGVAPEHINVSLGGHALYLEVDVPAGIESPGIPSGHHEVSVDLPAGIAPDALDASLANGVLRIRVSKTAAGPRRVVLATPE